jgi:hypothetical protein
MYKSIKDIAVCTRHVCFYNGPALAQLILVVVVVMVIVVVVAVTEAAIVVVEVARAVVIIIFFKPFIYLLHVYSKHKDQ